MLIRSVYCSSASPYTRTEDYTLDQKLGPWYPVRRHIQFDAYRSKSRIYYRDEIGLHACMEHAHQTGFFDMKEDVVQTPPLKSNPIVPNVVAPEVLWTHKPRKLVRQKTSQPPVEVIEFPEETQELQNIDLVSDAAVFVDEAKGAASWRILVSNSIVYGAQILLEVYHGSYSYREELMGLYRAIRDILDRFITVVKVRCHCDCKSAIYVITAELKNPGQLMQADMDVVLAIKRMLDDLSVDVDFVHVQGHAEQRKQWAEMTPIEQANVLCDRSAGEKAQSGETPQPFTPLPGSRCMLRISNRWVTARPDKAIQESFVRDSLQEYTAQRLNISIGVTNEIDNIVMGAVQGVQKWSQRVRTSTLLFGWLPVGHNWKHHGAETDLCPCCSEPDETFTHLLECKDDGITAVRRKCLREISATAARLKIPTAVYSLMIAILKRIHRNKELIAPPMTQSLKTAWESQQRIGFKNMAIGWLSQEWTKAMKAYSARDPTGCMVQMLTLIWDGWCEPIWEYRNLCYHKTKSVAMRKSLQLLDERLSWYQVHKLEVLAPRHHFLAEFCKADVIKWGRSEKRMQLQLLDKAKRIFEVECKQKVRGKRVITEMFPVVRQGDVGGGE